MTESSSYQPTPAPLDFHDRLGHAIKRAEQALIGEKSRVLRTVDLTVPQYVTLLVLQQSSGMSGAQLARECMVTPQTMTTILTNLENKGLITRETSSVHQKVLVAKLTRTGRALAKKADTLARGVEQRLADAFDDTEQAQLRELLERSAAALRKTD
ncbi:MarR family transcriptional regulator [Kitasatospora aureofaciens]|uniref:MarR family winged helix-turn-helix transcriptional regulator n=1 Tax=Kitasatospora aureofaciens TaxID=1894 RepID=UPI001D315228|nr:MarR family transcriptional regulator [Kitasatospora aureofaciens]HJD83592.1 MarR family transcriptional regulator [Kitasatospora aureofaciens]